jgi:hypothetical protein
MPLGAAETNLPKLRNGKAATSLYTGQNMNAATNQCLPGSAGKGWCAETEKINSSDNTQEV